MKVFYTAVLALGATMIVMSAAHPAEGDSGRGQRSFGPCAACHSLQPDRNMTGPSLAGLWDRKAGTLPSFSLRFKTDSGSEGPEKGAPALVGAGMMGDRADVIFAAPDEISAMITRDCNTH